MSGWKTNNQMYGSHYSKRTASEPKKKIGKSTLQYLQSLDKGGFIHQQQNIAKRQRVGLFSQPVGIVPGDPYKDPAIDKPEKRMEVNQKMQQKVGPELFSKLTSTNIGDPYKDQFRANQLYTKQKNDMTIHPKTFMAGGKQKFVKHSQFEHMKQFEDKRYDTRDQNGNVKTGVKNMYTNNMKKGFGNTTAGLFSSYPYQGYLDEEGKNKNSYEKMIHKAKIPVPFKGSSHPNKTFTPDYVDYNKDNEPYDPKKDDELYRGKSLQQWKYNNPNKKGYNGTFTAYPKYIDQGQKQKAPIKHQNIWLHNFNGTSKGMGETLARPCPAPSQMLLNQKRR